MMVDQPLCCCDFCVNRDGMIVLYSYLKLWIGAYIVKFLSLRESLHKYFENVRWWRRE